MDIRRMNEEEEAAWEEAERAVKQRYVAKRRGIAVVRAGEFCDRHDLTLMTIKKAFELGYIKGISDEQGL